MFTLSTFNQHHSFWRVWWSSNSPGYHSSTFRGKNQDIHCFHFVGNPRIVWFPCSLSVWVIHMGGLHFPHTHISGFSSGSVLLFKVFDIEHVFQLGKREMVMDEGQCLVIFPDMTKCIWVTFSMHFSQAASWDSQKLLKLSFWQFCREPRIYQLYLMVSTWFKICTLIIWIITSSTSFSFWPNENETRVNTLTRTHNFVLFLCKN